MSDRTEMGQSSRGGMIPNTANSMDVLKAIDEWASYQPEYEARRLWLILSALRGPDAFIDKDISTAIIRKAALPNMVDKVQYTIAEYAVGAPQLERLKVDALRWTGEANDKSDRGASHFWSHIQSAAESLLHYIK